MTESSGNPMIPSGLARRLVSMGLLDQEQASLAHTNSLKEKIPFVTWLAQNQIAEPRDVAMAAADEFGAPLLDLDAVEVDPQVVRLVDPKLIRRHHALPLYKRGNHLFVAVSDPTNLQALDEIKFHVGCATESVVVEEDKLARLLEKAIESAETSIDGMADESFEGLDFVDTDAMPETVTESEADDTPVVRFINKILLDAINRSASDIHIEPYEKSCRVRYRIDGVLQEVAQPPVALASRIVARVKVMSRLDISERRVPQDGRIKLALSKTRAIDFRVSTCPTLWGEKVVLRILDPTSAQMGIESLGYEPEQERAYLETLRRPYGMILVTGPTGSGKTVSLYTGVNILNTEDRNISTAEDPVEINLPGVNQVNVNPKVGLTFSAALRAFLRQDPDVILVGEIRDLETAEIAIKAAQTGHLVLSTLHTNDAPQTIARLVNMGVPSYNIASSVSLIIAQRLARRLCPHCKEEESVPREELLKQGFPEQGIDELKLYKAVGCDKCNAGYKGRTGIYQVMPFTEAIGRVVMEGGNAMKIADQSRKEGIYDLRMSGLRKVMAGVTSLEEINRVTKE